MYINLFRKSEAELSLAMPSNCTAYKCSNNSDQGFALFRYPHDEALRQKWVAAVGRGKDWSPKSSQKLCEIHFMPSDIEFVAGRKRVKAGAFPSRFCTCTTENREHPRKKQTSRSEPYRRQDSVGNNKQGKLKQINHCDHTYDGSALDQRTPLSVINTYNGMTYPRKRQGFSVQHQYDCVQSCKSLTKEEIQDSIGNNNNCAEKQKKIIEKIRRENNILSLAISLLQNILYNEKN